ncbi:type III secretion system inner rod subunit SctI [Escherichia coli]|nr:type III secretion system protein PrgJ [Escherichia coli]HDQ6556300.1 type III secretion system inner rod subunit SctI [Escherichia coli O103:H25]EET9403003.1 type III secretion system protein PrgJ [Escherichia coli]EET9459948.1 type III secretion system protein PrgJ [Escherichia coli]EEZ1236805.1 type III secretion system protein PrgJ [Escherichia coli]
MINAIFVPKTTPDLWDSARSETGVISLDDRLIQAFAGATAYTETEKMAVLQKIEQPGGVTDPAELYALQIQSANYNLQVSLISTLTRKCTGVVETLLRS